MKRVQWLRKTHKWFALFAGIQILIWSLSGLYMTFVDLDIIHGDHLVNLSKPEAINHQMLKPISPQLINELAPIKSINLKVNFGKPVYDIRTKKLRVIVDGLTGEKRQIVKKSVIQKQAAQIYAGEAQVANVELLEKYPAEIGGRKKSVWVVQYDDWLNSTLYFEPHSGRLLSKRSDLWRAFDFLWILHIMEYWGSNGFEGLFFRVLSLLSLFMALFGSWLLFYRLKETKQNESAAHSSQFSILSLYKRLHKWFALVIGLQLTIWIVSGIVFSYINHKNVDGGFIFKSDQTPQINQIEKLNELLTGYLNVTSVTQQSLLGKDVFKINQKVADKTKTFLVDLKTQKLITINETIIKQVAKNNYKGGGLLISSQLIKEQNDENRAFKLPVWKLVYDDEFESHIYFSNTSAEFLGVRTESWRTFDFFMMLHFMDYSFFGQKIFGMGERGNFNNGLVIFAGFVLFLFSFSGILLIFSAFSKSDFIALLNRFYKSRFVTIHLTDNEGLSKVIKTEPNHRLMDVLLENNIELESICGGGGICGCCQVKLTGKFDSKQDLSEHDYLDDEELKAGCRLACQLSVDKDLNVEVPNGILNQ